MRPKNVGEVRQTPAVTARMWASRDTRRVRVYSTEGQGRMATMMWKEGGGKVHPAGVE
jgi:hypothetical protein